MILYDADEAQHLTVQDNWISHPMLEAWTGADFLISPLSLPAHSEALLVKHLRAGGFLMNRKKDWDLLNSMQDSGNLWDMLLRMNEFCYKHKCHLKPAQKIILGIGVITGYADGSLKLNGQSPQGQHVTYWQFAGMKQRIFQRGGVFDTITNQGMLPWYLRMLELHAQSNLRGEKKYVVDKPEPMWEFAEDEPLQPMVRVKDGREVLHAFKGLGDTLINELWHKTGETLADALIYMSDPKFVTYENKPAGIGKKTIENFRAKLQIPEGSKFGYVPIEEESE